MATVERLSIRSRPSGMPIMYQTWGKLLFLHWPVPVEALRAKIPEPLQIDTYEDTAWVGITPFTMWNIRPSITPPLPLVSRSHELNVRTYVHLDGVPGVWFFSLEASNPLAVWGARLGFSLPYFQARMEMKERDNAIHFTSERTHSGAPAARFDATWTVGKPIGHAEPGTLEFFLIERYCLYTTNDSAILRARIFHHPWPLCTAQLHSLSSTMLEAHGLPRPDREPLLHAQGEPLDVAVWSAQKVA